MQGCVYWPGLSVRGGKCVSKDGGVCKACLVRLSGVASVCEQGWRGAYDVPGLSFRVNVV